MSRTATARVLEAALVGSLALVALLTLSPTGAGGWAWGDPGSELRWYAGALGSRTAATQLAGNLLLLAPSTVLAVLRRSGLGRVSRLLPLALAAGSAIECLQWALPLGRVVSPMDALLTAALRAGSGRPQRVWAGA